MLFLTNLELQELTDRMQASAQIRWLKEHRWVYAIGRDGMPKVARTYFEQRMIRVDWPQNADTSDSATAQPMQWHVNTDALRSPRQQIKD